MKRIIFAGIILTAIACSNKTGVKEFNKLNSEKEVSIKWKTDNENYYFFILNSDGSAELGQYNAKTGNLNPKVSDQNASWKIDEITWQKFDMETGDFKDQSARGFVVTDSEDLSYELEIVSETHNTVYLVSHDNLGPYYTFRVGDTNTKLVLR